MKQKHDYLKNDYFEDYGATYELAGLGERFFALVIDGVIIGIMSGIIAAISLGLLAAPAWFLVGIAYNWYYLTQNDGQTIGKRMMGVRVIKADGGKLTTIDAIIRYFGYSVNSFILSLGWLWAVIDENRQGWHDKLANTYVVRA